jgi:hypothetical protein
MFSRINHRKPLPQRCADAGARVRLQEMQRSGKPRGMRLSAEVDTTANDPGETS